MRSLKPHQIEVALPLLEALGFEFHLDYDDSVQIHFPPRLNPRRIGRLLGKYGSAAIARALKNRAHMAKRQYFGGPWHGKPHGWYWGKRIHARLAPKKWVAYCVDKEGRALYCGEATSEAKAKGLTIDKLSSLYGGGWPS